MTDGHLLKNKIYLTAGVKRMNVGAVCILQDEAQFCFVL